MKNTRDLNGLQRLKNSRTYKPVFAKVCFPVSHREQTEDTRIRRDIYRVIVEMITQGKKDVEIEMYLRNLYPDYSEYIPKVINDQFNKRKLNAKAVDNVKSKNDGDER